MTDERPLFHLDDEDREPRTCMDLLRARRYVDEMWWERRFESAWRSALVIFAVVLVAVAGSAVVGVGVVARVMAAVTGGGP